MPAHITCYIPGLLAPPLPLTTLPASELPDLSSLERLLSRADVYDSGPQHDQAALFSLLGAALPPSGDPPAAAVTYLLDTGRQEDAWRLRADPVYLQPDRDQLVLLAHETLALTKEEAAQLVSSINQHFTDAGWRLEAPTPSRWYLTLAEPPRLDTTPLEEVLGHGIADNLPQGKDASRWHGMFNELQMLLHSHPVNSTRESQGKLPVNSLWLWGGGRIPAVVPPPFDEVTSDLPLAQGLAQLGGLPWRPLMSLTESGPRQAFQEKALIIFPALPTSGRDIFAWLSAAQAFHDTWLHPLLEQLAAGDLSSVCLLPGDGREYRLQRPGLRRWWRKRRPLRYYCR